MRLGLAQPPCCKGITFQVDHSGSQQARLQEFIKMDQNMVSVKGLPRLTTLSHEARKVAQQEEFPTSLTVDETEARWMQQHLDCPEWPDPSDPRTSPPPLAGKTGEAAARLMSYSDDHSIHPGKLSILNQI